MRAIINITMEQLPHTSSSASGSMPRHTTTVKSLPAAQRSTPRSTTALQTLNAVASSSKTTLPTSPPHSSTKPRLPTRPSFGRREHYGASDSTFTRLATGIARVQAQPHKPKRPSPLHTSHSPESIADDISNSSNTSSPSEPSPDLCHVEHAGLGIIAEEKEKVKGNMLGLELNGNGWNWYGDVQERVMGPRTPFPSPAIHA
jgi:hypothetical protein